MVYMPPLTFDSAAPEPPAAPDPQTIVLLREARVQPEVVFRGHVEEAAPRAVASASPATNPLQAAPKAAPSVSKGPSLFTRFLNIFRRNKRAPCVGAGCNQTQS